MAGTNVQLLFMWLLSFLALQNQSADAAYTEQREIYMEVGQKVNITSPNYPDQYNTSLTITWSIIAPVDHRIIVTFIDFNSESLNDALIIGTGRSPSEPGGVRLLLHSGTEVPTGLKSPGRFLWIRFATSGDEAEMSDYSNSSSINVGPSVGSPIANGSIENVRPWRGFLIQLTTEEHNGCLDDEFECLNGYCIPVNATCDGINDCLDLSDEELCPQCITIPVQSCRDMVFHNSTFFPNLYAANVLEAETIFMEALPLASCNPYFTTLICHILYPECPYYGLTHGPCYRDCMETAMSCKDVFDATFPDLRPIDCEAFTDWTSNEGKGCLKNDNDFNERSVCGIRYELAPTSSARIIGGVTARPREFPWIASMRDYSRSPSHICGATLIDSQWAITAAHCVFGFVDSLVFGDIALNSTSGHSLSVTPSEVYVFPEYNSTSLHGDVALIKLKKAITFTPYVLPACLPDIQNTSKIFHRCLIAGWGVTSTQYGQSADVLQKAVVNIFDSDTCNELYDGALTDSMFCAGFGRGEISPCSGDSGGPLTCQSDDSRWHLIGVSSRGEGCAKPQLPGLYTNISEVMFFINAVRRGEVENVINEEIVDTENILNITSPNYPINYPSDIRQVWTITAPSDHRVRMTFVDLSLASKVIDHDGDTIYIGDGLITLSSTELAKVTWNESLTEVNSTSRHAWLMFVTNGVVSDRGFRMEIKAIPLNHTKPCTVNPCLNGATCTDDLEGPVCSCVEGYTGTRCEEEMTCGLEGVWYNDLNDQLSITKTSTGMLLGDYLTNIELITGWAAPTVVVGFVDDSSDRSLFGLVVSRDNGQSTTSWTGQCHLVDGSEVLYTSWTTTQQTTTCYDAKKSTQFGADKWTRYEQTMTPAARGRGDN